MSGVNKWIGIGHLGRDAEIRALPSGDAVCSFSVACTESYKTKSGERKEDTLWMNCALFGKRAEALAQYLTKGKQVYVEGGLRISDYTGRDGDKRRRIECRVSELQLLGGRGNAGTPHGDAYEPPQDGGPSGPDDDDIPF